MIVVTLYSSYVHFTINSFTTIIIFFFIIIIANDDWMVEELIVKYSTRSSSWQL